ncbi:methyl-accepting chemotaxis protein [Lysinibacillus varians]|uniref:Methyl-accepting chemotaxis protein n=1 Tax=Lysinibacillus varians TaxID=1145276 RepID=A0ABY2TEK1_9BACI|nr:methyl-accepting chemotaxis protein [Lysinibacillus varians]AHN21351.1 methyl-accepting chemotaxis protein [Lysinibacillus varians]TKI67123.1 methyl-accepting chemotaxis protein [Lysinibacillus varians]
MSIKKKIYLGFGSIMLFLLLSSTIAFVQLKSVNNKYSFTIEDRVYKLLQVDAILNASSLQGLYIRSYILDPSDETIKNLEKQEELIEQKTAELEKIIKNPEMQKQLQSIKENQAKFNQGAQDIINTYDKEDVQASIEKIQVLVRPANEGIQLAVNKISVYQKELMEKANTEATKIANNSSLIILGIAIVTTILALLISVFITRLITVPINKLNATAKVIAEGDLSGEDINVKTNDEIGVLADSFNEMKRRLHSIINNVAANVEQTTAAAEQLAASTDQVAISSNEVANRIEVTSEGANQSAITGRESATAMDETAHGVQRIAEATQLLNSKALDTQVIANEGGKTLQTAENQMAVIQQSSHETNERIKQLSAQSTEIEKIIKVITDITEQTNLLALNAAIEAARAGEHGKGFAVVADEVRKLAEESKASAHQIVDLTTSIQQETNAVEKAVSVTVQNVEEGVTFIQNAQVSFDTIMKAIQEITSQIEDVSASTEEISASTEEVAASVNEMASAATTAAEQSEMIAAAVEEQTATIQEINAVAKSLSEGAMTVQEEINKFKI